VLVLAGVELILFLAASIRLYFWICAENSVDNTGILVLSSAYTESRPLLPLTPSHL